jgi:glycine hydroxymethyltransferase
MTTRGFKEQDFSRVVDIIHRGVQIAQTVKETLKASKGSTKLSDFKAALGEDGEKVKEIGALKKEVVEWARSFPVVGFEASSMKYKS